MSFLDSLGDALTSTFSAGDNKITSLDLLVDGHIQKNGRLGDFAKKIDNTAQRQYVEEGYFRTSLFNPKQKQLELLMQEPDITILVKKRAFSSLADNYRSDLSTRDEQLFLRATKILFQNKAKQIAAFEKLTKIERIASEMGEVSAHLMPVLFAATDTLSAFDAIGLGIPGFDKFKGVVDKIRTVVNLNKDNIYTTWITNNQNSKGDLGTGTGVIEFTTGFSVSTTTSTGFGKGSFGINFIDPYNLMTITNNDIEQAISDATNAVFGSSFLQLGTGILRDLTQESKTTLNKKRAARGAHPIVFQVNPDTFLGKRIRAIIDGIGTEIQFEGSFLSTNVDAAYLFGSEVVGNEGLKGQEVSHFKQIISSLYNSLQINKNSRTITRAHNADTNSLRKKMRLHYGRKLMIQPMDVVHIFISSKTRVDTKIIGGLQDTLTGFGLMQTVSKSIGSLTDFFNAGKDNSIEKSLLVGSDFPNWLWLLMRNQFVNDKSGMHVFAGLVKSASSSFNNGFFSVDVSGSDNTEYFNFGVVNYKPALEVFNGSLYDPLTPFDIKFDAATGMQKDSSPELLKENKELFQSAFVKYKSGLYVGKKPTINNFTQDTEKVKNVAARRVFYDPDGMVYKWKEGIGTLVLFGNNYDDGTGGSQTSVPKLTNDPFAGQDIMNALSLLITGEPYNFATFYKAAMQFDNNARDAVTGQDPSVSFFKNFQSDLKYRNLLYGNFVPFKKLTMDESTYKNTLNNIINANAYDSQLTDLISKRADLNDRILALTNNGQAPNIQANDYKEEVDRLNIEIDTKIQSINTELNKINKPISIIGDDVSIDYNTFLDTPDKNKLHKANQYNRELRRKTHYLTRRLSWKVRANEDVNFFIVDDTYDKDYDIQAFEKAFVNPDIFKSDYLSVSDQITRIAAYLDLEVFADSQGHIQIRPPQYNKIPSSVFYRMLRLKEEFDIQIYPQFLEDLYVDQIEGILSRIETLEDEIRLYGIALSKSNDDELAAFLTSQTQNVNTNGNSTPFAFISDRGTGCTPRLILKDLSASDDPVGQANVFGSGLNAISSVQTQATINNIFSISSRAALLKGETLSAAVLSGNASSAEERDKIIARLEQKTGQRFDFNQLFSGTLKLPPGAISNTDLLKMLREISYRISERQRIIKIAAGAIKNAKEGLSLIKDKNNFSFKLSVPGLLGNSDVPQAFESFIEDESYDDYGPESGKRYVIKNHHIKSIIIEERSPPHTAVEVQGRFGDNFALNLPSQLNAFDKGGNALTTVTAVDYDLWRMYGVRIPSVVDAPFLTDPQTQCAPFAVALLNKARKQIFGGSITIAGNEYMQPGEVVYVENQDCLYYVESVSHRFAYNREFSTVLNVGFGHMPGEYIPTYLDTAGKILYKNRDITNFVNMRQDNVKNEEHIGSIMVISDSFFSTSSDLTSGLFALENAQALQNILQAAQSAFSVNATVNYQPTLEIRTYYASQNGSFSSPNSNTMNLAASVKSFLTGSNASLPSLSKDKSQTFLKNYEKFILQKAIDSNDPEEDRSPSSQAYNLARQALLKQSIQQNKNSITAVDSMLYKYVVDVWIRFADPKDLKGVL